MCTSYFDTFQQSPVTELQVQSSESVVEELLILLFQPVICHGDNVSPLLELPRCIDGSGPASNTWFLGPIWVHNPNGMSIGSAIFAEQNMRNWQNYLNFGPQLLAERIKTPE